MKQLLLSCIRPRLRLIVLVIAILQFNSEAFAQPLNDNCVSAVTLFPAAPGAACAGATNGTVANATNSGIPVGACVGNPDDDVWYMFTATSINHIITITNIAANLAGTGGGPRIQVFSGTCAGLTSMGCGTTSINLNTFAVGSVYYIRVYSTNSTKLTTTGTFSICITTGSTAIIDFGKSYVNISKPNSGTVEFGDTLEIRASVVVRAGTFDSLRFNDNIPVGTTYIPTTLRILTNEGKIFRQFTDLKNDATNDQGWIVGSAITMNIGYNAADNPATMSRRGRMKNTHKPSFYGSSCIIMASYRIKVAVAVGSIINTGGGTITYSNLPNPVNIFTFPTNPVAVYTNYGMCANATGTNTLGTEFNGTFGFGPTRNRGTSANVPTGYTYAIFTNGGPNDYYYGIANNTSTVNAYTTLNTWAKPDNSSPTHRVFSVWDVIGDHTGAASPTAGNPATDTVANHKGGYMLIVNAAYRIDSAFQQTISNLCPNTYYEISTWIRNICSKCGCDSNGVGASGGAGYIPTAPGDSAGVYPNITYEVDGVDYYTTGYIKYTGQWVKRGFTILTGPTQDSFTLKLFNNAPGGGGNDWALDDISVATCMPNMKYSPSITPNVCKGNPLTVYDTVRSFFNNYVYYKWQRSTDGGTTWTDVTGVLGPAIPTWNGTAWQYVTSYTVPPGQTGVGNTGDKYRVIVGTTGGNLSDINCSSTDVTTIVTLTVIDCGPPLNTRFIAFNGKINNSKGNLNWSTNIENEPLFYDIEKSTDGSKFVTIGTVSGHNDQGIMKNDYSFTDPENLTGQAYYRIGMRTVDGAVTYSRILQLSSSPDVFSFTSVINPFVSALFFDISSTKDGVVTAELIDQFGKPIKKGMFDIRSGVTQLSFDNTGALSAGIYILRAEMAGTTIYKRVIKQNR